MSSTGGKFVWKDDQETANTQQASLDFGDAQITFEVRNLPTAPEGLVAGLKPNYAGNIFFGEAGFLVMDGAGFQVYKSSAFNVSGEAARGASAGGQEKYEKIMDEKSKEAGAVSTNPHMLNFFAAIRARDHKLLHAEIALGARSAAYVHLANISLRVGRTLRMDQSTGRFLNDDQANAMLTRDYREPFVVPRAV